MRRIVPYLVGAPGYFNPDHRPAAGARPDQHDALTLRYGRWYVLPARRATEATGAAGPESVSQVRRHGSFGAQGTDPASVTDIPVQGPTFPSGMEPGKTTTSTPIASSRMVGRRRARTAISRTPKSRICSWQGRWQFHARVTQALVGIGLRDFPEGKIDAVAAKSVVRTSVGERRDPVNRRRSGPPRHHDIAMPEWYADLFVGPIQSAEHEGRGEAERHRNDRLANLLVPVLVEGQTGARLVAVDEAGIGCQRVEPCLLRAAPVASSANTLGKGGQ